MKRTILVAVLLVACILSATVGGTVAWFTDKVEVKNQILTAGNLDIELYKDGTPVTESTDVFTKPALWEPGAVAYADLSLKNVGNLALNYNMRLDVLEENTVKGTDYKLSDVLKIAFVDVEATDRATVLAAAKGKGVAFSEFAVEGSLLPGEENSFNDGLLVVYWEPSAEDNNWNVNNGKTTSDGAAALHIDFGVVVEAAQKVAEEDSFGSDYDANASTKVQLGSTATANAENLRKMIDAAEAGSTIYVPNGDYEFTWAAGSPIEITKSLTLIGESESGVNITVKDGFGFRISDNVNPESDMKVTLKNMTLTAAGATRQGIYAKYNVTVDLYNVSVKGFNGDIWLDNGNTYSGVNNGLLFNDTKTIVNAYNVVAEKVMLGALPNSSVSADYTTYAYFNYDSASNIGYIGRDSAATPNKNNLFVNGVALTNDIDNIQVIDSVEDFAKIANGGYFKLERNVEADADDTITIAKGKSAVLDLNGCTIASVSDVTGNNREMFLVKGNLTISNGTVTTEHDGANMEWNAMTTVFDITDGGVLTLNGVNVENKGGSDMAFAVHMNNWGKVTLNADNCTFKSPYVAIRAFNSGYDMNIVNVKNSTVHGNSNALWVHNYIGDLDSTKHTDEAIKARLDIDSIFDSSNTVTSNREDGGVVRYGFDNAVYYKADGTVVS